MLVVAEQFIHHWLEEYLANRTYLSTQRYGGDDSSTWYPKACKFLKIEHISHTYSCYGKSIIEHTIQYVKDRTECFDDYFPCRKERDRQIERCKLEYVMKWLLLFVHI